MKTGRFAPPPLILYNDLMQIQCPLCKTLITWEENPSRPFCSERCKLIDLGEWASEKYRVEVKMDIEDTETLDSTDAEIRNGKKSGK